MPARKSRDASSSRPESNDPYYLEIANRLRVELVSGKFRAGQRFYSIRGLIRDTGRSLPTVRSALALLIKEELLEARQGSGYYVTAKAQARSPSNRGFLNFLAVIPSSSVPDEPWFTGKISLGMIGAANQDHAVVSFYRRQNPGNRNAELARTDLDRIMAMRPDGIAWLHSMPEDAGILQELRGNGLPIVTTMRRVPPVEDLPLIREDDIVYATMVLSNFEARGHRRIGVILRSLNDDYFRSKADALRDVASSSQVTVSEEDFFFLPASDPQGIEQAEPLRQFLDKRRDLTGILVLASTGITPIIKLFNGPMAERVKRLSLIYNVLDGVAVPELPTREKLATICPPLERLGAHLIHFLTSEANGRQVPASGAFVGAGGCVESESGGTAAGAPQPPKPTATRLIPVFQPGDSLRQA